MTHQETASLCLYDLDCPPPEDYEEWMEYLEAQGIEEDEMEMLDDDQGWADPAPWEV